MRSIGYSLRGHEAVGRKSIEALIYLLARWNGAFSTGLHECMSLIIVVFHDGHGA